MAVQSEPAEQTNREGMRKKDSVLDPLPLNEPIHLPDFIESSTMEELDEIACDWPQALALLPDADFWRSLIDDPDNVRLKAPLQLASKIRSGVPPRLRGIVWQSLTKARSTFLQTVYQQLIQESSPYERVIRRDLPRTFPQLQVFKREDGEAQRRLFRILKAYSLYDAEVGYCQGLGFIIGPLILNMDECSAFCTLVRLMETYELRGMFTEDMAGLHLRLFQFQELAREVCPRVCSHLSKHTVHVEMFAPSWFLSLFAYTMPLGFVLRLLDVVMMEGVETIIRLAIALLQRNQERILQQDDFESLMCVLNGGLFDEKKNKADRPSFLLEDVARLSAVVTRERLVELEQRHRGTVEEDRATEAESDHKIKKFLAWPWSKDSSANSGPKPKATTQNSSDNDGSGLELTSKQLAESQALREQMLGALQKQDNAPLTMLGHRDSAEATVVEAPLTPLSTTPGEPSTMWRHAVLEPLEQQLHDARVTSDTHRDALVALQAEMDILHTDLVVAKTSNAQLAEDNERLRMLVRRMEAEQRELKESLEVHRERAQRSEEMLIRTKVEMLELDEHPPNSNSSSSSSSRQRFSLGGWPNFRGIVSPRQSMQEGRLAVQQAGLHRSRTSPVFVPDEADEVTSRRSGTSS
ncbi:hypothetical protein GGI25_001873 [Coemansia spiralis]|uniref:Rab-GAP TBC domain-containing protein n=1 Tax=Coemansia spiralis TaxID=417178 RepID=A0A9W8GBX7_9FUNG|nr:hypothetical protein GGI25_001873 [Coemansia spiralis]